jgi:FKBP-type peptidyl-prolyl cis-trans isomerase FkpA
MKTSSMSGIYKFYLVLSTLYLILCSSCGNSRFPDFSETKNGLFYKIEDVGEGEKRARPGDYITAQIVIKTEKDSVLFNTQKMGLDGAVTFILPAPAYEKDYREGYTYLSEGDSAAFITDAYTIFIKRNHTMIPKGMSLESVVRVETKVLKITTQEEHAKEVLTEQAKLEEGEFEEKKTLQKYISDSGISDVPVSNGMYYIKLAEGKGVTPDSGRVALLNYRGYFLNGRCFDSSFETQPFEYIIGAEEQLIPGLAFGVRRMHEGEKAKFIIPSHLAFGSSGSSTGVIPPFTSVIYEVELLKVQ